MALAGFESALLWLVVK